MKQIQLTHGKMALVDDEDFCRLSAHLWSAVRAKSSRETWYAKRLSTTPDGKILNIYMHREILDLGEGEEADHKDYDGLNNQRSNLRRCDRSLNCANKVYETPSSGYRGVYCERGRYRAQASRNRRKVNIGSFDSPAEAAMARDDYVFSLYGEFAILNFPRTIA